MTAPPPLVLRWPVVEIARPQPPPVSITARAPAVVIVAWPRVRVVGDRPPPAPRMIRLAAPPQGPWRLTFPQGHPLRNMELYDLPGQ